MHNDVHNLVDPFLLHRIKIASSLEEQGVHQNRMIAKGVCTYAYVRVALMNRASAYARAPYLDLSGHKIISGTKDFERYAAQLWILNHVLYYNDHHFGLHGLPHGLGQPSTSSPSSSAAAADSFSD